MLNAFPYTAYAQNVGLVGLTRVKSRYVVAAAGVILVLLGLLPKLAAVVACIPAPVLGGAGIAMFGMVAASGMRTLSRVSFTDNHNLMVVAISIGVGLIPVALPDFYSKFPPSSLVFLNSGISIGSIVAILLNALLNRTTPSLRENSRA
jgi:NCS2 family nucleobase:cation symporter-2